MAIFLIPSYRRSDKATTPELLKGFGYRQGEIIISTQTDEDYEAYQRKFGEIATVVFRKASNCPGNRNTLLEHVGGGAWVVMLDDDIRSFCRLEMSGEEKRLRNYTSREQLDSIFGEMFRFCRTHKAPVWGWYPVANAYFMDDTVDTRNILCGTILGIMTKDWLRFDESMGVKEDYELSLRLMKKGFNVVRFNGYTVEANHYGKGGCEEVWADDTNRRCAKELIRRYPKLVKPSHREGEIVFKGKRR